MTQVLTRCDRTSSQTIVTKEESIPQVFYLLLRLAELAALSSAPFSKLQNGPLDTATLWFLLDSCFDESFYSLQGD